VRRKDGCLVCESNLLARDAVNLIGLLGKCVGGELRRSEFSLLVLHIDRRNVPGLVTYETYCFQPILIDRIRFSGVATPGEGLEPKCRMRQVLYY